MQSITRHGMAGVAGLWIAGIAGAAPPISGWERQWEPLDGGWALADLSAVAPDGAVYVTARPQVGFGNGSAVIRYAADGTFEWAVVNEFVPDRSEGFGDIEITDEGVALVTVIEYEPDQFGTLVLDLDTTGAVRWDDVVVGPQFAGFLAPQLVIGPNGERIVASDDGSGVGEIAWFASDGTLLNSEPLSFSGFGGVSALESLPDGDVIMASLLNFDTYQVQRIAPDGTVEWTRTQAGSGLALGEAFIAVVPNGDIVVTGTLELFQKKNPRVSSRVWRYAPDGTLQWAIDSDPNFAVSLGITAGLDGAVYVIRNLTIPGSELVRIDDAGNEVWSRSFDGIDFTTNFTSLATDAFGNIVVGGADRFDLVTTQAARVMRYTPAGDLLWSGRLFEGVEDENVFAGRVAVGANGAVAMPITHRDVSDFDRAYVVTRTFSACTGDLDGDGAVAFSDLLIVLASFGPQVDHPADFDQNGEVDFGDLLVVLSAFGGACGS